MINILTLAFTTTFRKGGADESTRSQVYFTQHFTNPTPTGLSRLGEAPSSYCHTAPTYPPLTDPGPETWPLEALTAQPGPSGRREPQSEETDQLPSPSVRLPLCSASAAGQRPGHLQSLAGARASSPSRGPRQDRTGPAAPREAEEAGDTSRPAMTPPWSLSTPSAGPHPAPGRPAASAPPPQPLTGAGTVLRRRGRAARGPGEVAVGRGTGRAPNTASASSTRQGREKGEPQHNSPRVAPAAAAAARARRRLSLGGGHYASCSRTPHSSPSRPSARPLLATPSTRLPAPAFSTPCP